MNSDLRYYNGPKGVNGFFQEIDDFLSKNPGLAAKVK